MLVWVTEVPGRAGKEREGASAGDRPTFTIAYDSPAVPHDHPPNRLMSNAALLPPSLCDAVLVANLMFFTSRHLRGFATAIPITTTMTKEPCRGPHLRTSLSSSSPSLHSTRAGRPGGVY